MNGRHGFVDRTSASLGLVITYVVMMAAVPMIDFRGQAFFIILTLEMLSPYILIELALWAIFVNSAITAVRRACNDGAASRHLFVLSALLIIPLVVNAWLMFGPVGWPDDAIRRSALYQSLTSICATVLLVAILGILIGVPIRSLIVGIVHLRFRRWRDGLLSLSVLAIGYAFHVAGQETNDRLTIQWCSSMPNKTLDKGISVCPLESILTFPEYIVRSTTTTSQDELVRRVAKGLNEETCYFSARRMTREYYWVNETC